MKWSELRRIAKNNGWYFLRHGAKHDIYIHEEKDYYIHIGRHASEEIRKGTYNDLKKKIGF